MPLTRYEIRNEYSLANPDLYRSAAKDDPEGLLEGVAMSGLVGIVRQLGDLAEFAAEVFHDLHEEVLATGARSHELLIRVQQLEGELPFVEKLMFSESCYVNFAYNPGSEWHANIQNAQNHFTQGDLPRFIRNAYEDCRGPPRLFLLDKFDIAGAGACLKRYTDPSFFRMEWASSELMKAEKEQQERRARRIKKKGRRHRNGERRDPLFALHMQPRIFPTSSKVENEASTSVPAQPLESQHGLEQGGSNPGLQSPEQNLEFSGLSTCEEHVSNLMANVDGTDSGGNIREASVEATEGLLLQDHDCKQSQSSKVSEEILRQDLQSEDASLNTPSSSPQQEHNPDEHHIATDDARSISSEYNADAGSAEAGVTNDIMLEKKGLPTCVQENEDITDFASETDNYVDALTTIDSEVETDSEFKMVSQGTGQSSQSLTSEEDRLHQVACENLQGEHQGEFVVKDQLSNVVDSLRESESEKRTEPACVESQANNFLSSDDDLAPQKSTVPMVDSGSPKSLVMRSTVQDGHFMDSQSRAVIPETPKTPEANEDESLKVDTSSSASHQLSEPAILLDNGSQTPTKHFDSLTQHFAEKSSDIDTIVLSTEQHCQDNSGHPDSEASNNMELSPHSSEKSSVQAIKWSIDFPRHCNIVLDSDDELDEMHVSSSSSSPSPSPSSSSSILSSPRPSTLATTFFTKKPESPQTSVTSSPKSISHLSPDSAEIVAPSSSIHLLETDADSSRMLPPDFEKDSPRHSLNEISGNDLMPYLKSSFHSFPGVHIAEPLDDQSILEDGPEHFPPPPPLPPLEWRTSRRFGSIISSSVKESEPMPNITIKPQRKLQESFEPSNQPLFHQSNCTEHNEGTQCTAEHGDFRGSSAYSDILEQIENEESQQIHRDHDEGIHVSQIPLLHGGFQGCAAHLGSPEHPQNEEESHCSTDSKTILPCSEAISSNLEIPDILQSPKILVEPYTHEGTRNFMHQADSVIQSETSCLEQSSFPSVSDLETYDVALPSEASLNDSFVDNKEQDSTVPVVQKDNHSLDRLITVNISQEIIGPLSMQHDISDEDSGKSSPKIKTIPIPSVVDQLSNGTKPPSGSSKLESERLSRTSNAPKVEKRDPLISAIASHDRSMPRKVPDWSQSSRTSRTDDREVLLEQIRTGSFSLRRTKVEKQEIPRRITNVNVAAILEKANAIRQAFAGSDDDEDDDWSDD